MPDHVHMLLSVPPKYSVSNVMGVIKGKSAIHIARVYAGRRRNFVGPAFFGRGGIEYRRSAKTRLPCVNISKTRKRKTNASNNWNWGCIERLLFLTALSGSRYLKPPALPEVTDLGQSGRSACHIIFMTAWLLKKDAVWPKRLARALAPPAPICSRVIEKIRRKGKANAVFSYQARLRFFKTRTVECALLRV